MKKILFSLFLLITLTACNDTVEIKNYNHSYNYFNTSITINLYSESDIKHEDIFIDIENILKVNHELSDKRNIYPNITNLKIINDNTNVEHVITNDLYNMIEESINYYNKTDKQFNIAMSPVIEIWDEYMENCNINKLCEVPNIEELNTLSSFINLDNVILNKDNNTILLEDNMSLDLGGIAKSYAANKITEYLINNDINNFTINAGSSTIILNGKHPEDRPWDVGLTNPINTNEHYKRLSLFDVSISSSGDYESFFVVDNERYHHIISPDTLFPGIHNKAVTAISDNPIITDIYSTALFLLPPTRALELVNSIDGLEVIIFDSNNIIHTSNNFDKYF